MFKVGRISAAIGFIFLGISMILHKFNPTLGIKLLKLWPIILVFLGIEILMVTSRNREQRIGFSFMVVLVMILFLITNLTYGLINKLNMLDLKFDFINIARFIEDIDVNNYKVIEANKILDGGNLLDMYFQNAKVIIKPSTNNKINIEAKVFVEKNSNINSYNIKEVKINQGYKIDFSDEFIKKAEVYLCIPQNSSLYINGNNIDVKTDNMNKNLLTKINIDGVNVNTDVENIEILNLKGKNLNVNGINITRLNVEGINCNADLDGEIPYIDAVFSNGKVDINNLVCKDVNIKMGNGIAEIEVNTENIKVGAKVESGKIKLGKDKRVNSSITKVFGNGENKLNVEIERGIINIDFFVE